MNANRWKYEIVNIKPGWSAAKQREKLKQSLDEMGAKGWELVSMPPVTSALAELVLVFKRPV